MTSASKETPGDQLFSSIHHRPESFRALGKFYDTVMGPGALQERLKDLVFLAVSAVNESGYCGKALEIRARENGIADSEIEDVRAETDYHFTDRERAALRYAREVTRTSDAERETKESLDNWFNSEERVELTMVIALANLTNRISNALDVPAEQAVLPTATGRGAA